MKLLPTDFKPAKVKIDNTPTVSNSDCFGLLDIHFYSEIEATGLVALWQSLDEIKSDMLRTEGSELLRKL